MKIFKIKITRKITAEVFVEAKNVDEAALIVKYDDEWHNDEAFNMEEHSHESFEIIEINEVEGTPNKDYLPYKGEFVDIDSYKTK